MPPYNPYENYESELHTAVRSKIDDLIYDAIGKFAAAIHADILNENCPILVIQEYIESVAYRLQMSEHYKFVFVCDIVQLTIDGI
jgi:hypothetical protein